MNELKKSTFEEELNNYISKHDRRLDEELKEKQSVVEMFDKDQSIRDLKADRRKFKKKVAVLMLIASLIGYIFIMFNNYIIFKYMGWL